MKKVFLNKYEVEIDDNINDLHKKIVYGESFDENDFNIAVGTYGKLGDKNSEDVITRNGFTNDDLSRICNTYYKNEIMEFVNERGAKTPEEYLKKYGEYPLA